MTAEAAESAVDTDGSQREQTNAGTQPERADEAAGLDDSDDLEDAGETVEQLRHGAPHAFPHGNTFGPTKVTGDAVGGDKFVTIHTTSGLARSFVSGPVPPEDLASLVERFARPPDHDELVRRLRAKRVLVLCGSPGSGRRASALAILADVQQDPSTLRILDPTASPEELVKHLRPGVGHLIADFSGTADAPLRQHHLHAFQESLEENNGYVVITTDALSVLNEPLNELCEWHPPAAVDVLRAHLDATYPDPSEYRPALEREEIRTYLKAHPSPKEVAEFAGWVNLYVQGILTPQDLTIYGTAAAEHLARRAFADTKVSLRDKAFLIALAVFDRSPYATIAEAGDSLYLAFKEREEPEHPAGLSIFDTSRSTRLAWARAIEYDQADINRGVASTRMTKFGFSSTWSVVLQHVWLEHPAAREPILGWLRRLSESNLLATRIRAGVAAGCLAAVDFSPMVSRLFGPWASSDLLRQRQLAAWALSVTVQQGAETEVRRLLQVWTVGSVAKRWTVVRTAALLAELLGKSTIPLLFKIARYPSRDPRLQRELERVTSDLLTGPTARHALEALSTWSQDNGPCQGLAYRAFVSATAIHHQDARPALMTDMAADLLDWTALVTLWRAVLNDPSVRDTARRNLARWVVVAAQEESLKPDILRLFTDLAASANEHDRLDYLLRHLPPDTPSSALQLAARIRTHLLPH